MHTARKQFTYANLRKMNHLTFHLVTLVMVFVDQTAFVSSYSPGHGGLSTPLRHYAQHNRFPNLQRVQLKLESPHHVTTTTVPPELHPRLLGGLRSANEYSKSPEEDYDDDELYDDDEEDEDIDDHQNYQPHAEGGRPPWESESHRQDSQPPMSQHSQFKWSTFGQRSSLDEYRNSRLQPSKKRPVPETNNQQEAIQHAVRIYREGSCKVPRPKVIKVKDIYPNPSKTYVPHCTILHQCGDDTGCCKTDSHSCVAKHTHRVELYFWATTHGVHSSADLGSRYRQQPPTVVEKLVFYNHTECGCDNKNADLMPRDMEPTRGRDTHVHTHFRPSHARIHEPPPMPKSNSCQCPADFSPRYLEDGSCKCECFDKQRGCLRLKRGKEYFTHQDRLCIERKQCQLPVCEFGNYLKVPGRCMNKQEKFASWHSYGPRHDFR